MIEVSRYSLKPLNPLNARADEGVREGLFFRVKDESGRYGYGDCFPHPELGDLPVEAVLSGERDRHVEKCLWFARNERKLSAKEKLPFKNHLLTLNSPAGRGKIVKLKVAGSSGLALVREALREAMEKNFSLRLDPNGSVALDGWVEFLKTLSKSELQRIDYIEDPGEGDWRRLPVPAAKDFMNGPHWDVEIYKPNARFCERPESAVFSSYMGSDLGRWHAYLELINRGDLDAVHGIDTPGIYARQRRLFIGTNKGLIPDMDVVGQIYRELEQREWTPWN